MKKLGSAASAAPKRRMAKGTTPPLAGGMRARPVSILVAALSLAVLCSCADHGETRRVIVVGGDCLLDRRDGSDSRAPAVDGRWEAIAAACAGSDAFLCNLETTIGRAGRARPARFSFRAPESALAPFRNLPRPMVALANNHAMDFGPEGLLATLSALDAVGISHAGAGRTESLARGGIALGLSGLDCAFLSFGFDGDPSSYSDAPGACIAPLELETMVSAVASRARESAVTVVMLHWGNEYDPRFTARQREIAHRLVDAGADAILGVGPHVLQGIELYRGSLVCYSLGNLVFDDLGDRETSATVLVRMRVSVKNGQRALRFDLAPFRTARILEGPRVPAPDDAVSIMRAVADRSPDPRILSLRPVVDASSGLAWYRVLE